MSMEMTEFKITSDLSALRQQVISANFAEVKAWLDENLAPYRGMAVQAENVAIAKNYRASIRKVKDRIDQSRKEAKAAALAAYSDFEAKCKTLTQLCDEAADAIDIQIKAIEQKERDAKLDYCRNYYETVCPADLREFCPWEHLYSSKWENKGTSAEAICAEIENSVETVSRDLEAIRSVGGEDTAYLLELYKQNHNLNLVLLKLDAIRETREREAARKAAEEAALKKALREPESEPEAAEEDAEQPDEPLLTVDFRVVATKSQLMALKAFLLKNGIKYGKVK